MLGAFPPKKEKWSMEFFYPNFINDMWRIFGYILFNNKEHFVDVGHKTFHKESIIKMLSDLGIALGDTAKSVVRLKDNASDKFLQVEEAIDIHSMIEKLPNCIRIYTKIGNYRCVFRESGIKSALFYFVQKYRAVQFTK